MNLFELRMLRAALKQALRDQSEMLTPRQIDEILEQISRLTKVIDKLEKRP